jgi:hypothetical protein
MKRCANFIQYRILFVVLRAASKTTASFTNLYTASSTDNNSNEDLMINMLSRTGFLQTCITHTQQ